MVRAQNLCSVRRTLVHLRTCGAGTGGASLPTSYPVLPTSYPPCFTSAEVQPGRIEAHGLEMALGRV
jgi:hypothetical protein